jgi:hypothetical protein
MKCASVSSARRWNQECLPACLCWGGASSSSRRAAALLYARAPARTRARAFAFAAGNGPPASSVAHDDNDDETHAPSATKSKIVCGPESSSRDEKKKKKKKSHRTTRRIIAWLTPPLKKCETHDQVPASFLPFVLCFFPLPHVFSRNGERGDLCWVDLFSGLPMSGFGFVWCSFMATILPTDVMHTQAKN